MEVLLSSSFLQEKLRDISWTDRFSSSLHIYHIITSAAGEADFNLHYVIYWNNEKVIRKKSLNRYCVPLLLITNEEKRNLLSELLCPDKENQLCHLSHTELCPCLIALEFNNGLDEDSISLCELMEALWTDGS